MAKVSVDVRQIESVGVGYSVLRVHDNLGSEMADMDLHFGDCRVCLNFKSWEAMISFCEAHNFPYQDKRQ